MTDDVQNQEPQRQAPKGNRETAPATTAHGLGPGSVFLYGGFGGIAPWLLELAERVRSADPTLSDNGLVGELVAMVIFAGVGGMVARMKEEKTMWHAFTAGVTALAVVSGTAGLPSTGPGLTLFETTLYAAEQEECVEDRGRRLTLEADVALLENNIFIRCPGSSIEREMHLEEDGTWKVPSTTFYLVFRGVARTRGQRVPVTTAITQMPEGEEPLSVELTIEQTFLGGLLDGLGLDQIAPSFVDAEITARD